jgi:hypothetical protein
MHFGLPDKEYVSVIRIWRLVMETQIKQIFENNKKMIMGYADVHPDDFTVVDGTVDRLTEMGVKTLLSAELMESGDWGWELLLTDDCDNTYFLQLNRYGGIELLRRDNSSGDVIYAVYYDAPEGME